MYNLNSPHYCLDYGVHFNPDHSDTYLDQFLDEAVQKANPAFQVIAGLEGATFVV